MRILDKEIEIIEESRRLIEISDEPDVVQHRTRLLHETTMLDIQLRILRQHVAARDESYSREADRQMGAFFGVRGPSFRVSPEGAGSHNFHIGQLIQGLLGKSIEFDRFAETHLEDRSCQFGDIVTGIQTVYWSVSSLKSDMLVAGPSFEVHRDGPSRDVYARPVYPLGRGPRR